MQIDASTPTSALWPIAKTITAVSIGLVALTSAVAWGIFGESESPSSTNHSFLGVCFTAVALTASGIFLFCRRAAGHVLDQRPSQPLVHSNEPLLALQAPSNGASSTIQQTEIQGSESVLLSNVPRLQDLYANWRVHRHSSSCGIIKDQIQEVVAGIPLEDIFDLADFLHREYLRYHPESFLSDAFASRAITFAHEMNAAQVAKVIPVVGGGCITPTVELCLNALAERTSSVAGQMSATELATTARYLQYRRARDAASEAAMAARLLELADSMNVVELTLIFEGFSRTDHQAVNALAQRATEVARYMTSEQLVEAIWFFGLEADNYISMNQLWNSLAEQANALAPQMGFDQLFQIAKTFVNWNTPEEHIIPESFTAWFCALAKRMPALVNDRKALDSIQMAVILSKVDIPIEILTPAMNALASRVIEGKDRIPLGGWSLLAICAFADSNIHSELFSNLVTLLMPQILNDNRFCLEARDFIPTARAFSRRDIPIEFRAQIMNMMAVRIIEGRGCAFSHADYVKIVEIFTKSDIQSDVVREAVDVVKRKMLDRLDYASYVSIHHIWFEVQTYMAWVECGISLPAITNAINVLAEKTVSDSGFLSADQAAKTASAFVGSGIRSEEINQAWIKLASHHNREVAEVLPLDVCKELAERISVLNRSEDRSTFLALSARYRGSRAVRSGFRKQTTTDIFQAVN